MSTIENMSSGASDSPTKQSTEFYFSPEYQRYLESALIEKKSQAVINLLLGKQALGSIGAGALLDAFNRDRLLGRGIVLPHPNGKLINHMQDSSDQEQIRAVTLQSLIWEAPKDGEWQIKRLSVGVIDADKLGLHLAIGQQACSEEKVYDEFFEHINKMPAPDAAHLRSRNGSGVYGIPLFANNQLTPVPLTVQLVQGFIESCLDNQIVPLLITERNFASFPLVA